MFQRWLYLNANKEVAKMVDYAATNTLKLNNTFGKLVEIEAVLATLPFEAVCKVELQLPK